MASAKGGGSTKRSSPSRSSKKTQQPEVSPARWAGVALVIAAIMGAIFLAMISPSETGEPGQPAVVAEAPSPSPSSTAVDVPLPVVAPVIVNPIHGEATAELEIPVTVDVPDDTTVPRKHLELHVYYGSEIKTVEKPKPGTTVIVQGVRLAPGQNTLTAALGTRGVGPGPVSEPVVITLDEDLPDLEITSPKTKTETYDETIVVEFTSEIGAEVKVMNEAVKKFDPDEVIGAGGKGSLAVPLKYGKNHIEATSTDQAGLKKRDAINVTRLDGRPRIKLKHPESVNPPDSVRIVVEVKDSEDRPMPNAEVNFQLGGANRTADSEIGSTNEKGRAVWNVQVEDSSSPGETLEVAVVVISPTGDEKTADGTIDLK